MGLITGYETIKSHAYYFLNFELMGQRFGFCTGIEDAAKALGLVNLLKAKDIRPNISRKIAYDNTKSSYLTEEPEYQDITEKRLEKIVRTNEPLPELKWPIVESTYRC